MKTAKQFAVFGLALAILAFAGCLDGQKDDSGGTKFERDGSGTDAFEGDGGGGTDDTGTSDGTSDTYDPGPDTGTMDSGDDDEDAGPCGGNCGTNASCVNGTCECDSGYTGDPYSKCTKEMEGSCSSRSDCGQFAVCIANQCKCEWGFQPKSGSDDCERPSVGDPSNRNKSQVCQRWNDVQSGITSDLWAQAPQQTCDPGVLKPVVHWEAIRATNGYRWLIGLDPVASKKSLMDTNQECAMMMAANNTIDHNPPSSWQCYTQTGASGAGSSNLSQGIGHPAPTVTQYIKDRGNRGTMGHRRWIFNPGMGVTGFGHRDTYGCMYSFDTSGPDSQSVIRYPSRGPFPMSALKGPWNYFETGTTDFSGADVTVTDTSNGQKLSVSNVSQPSGSYGRIYGVVWEVSGAQTGATYRIEVKNYGSSNSKSASYETTLVQCP